MTMTLFSIISVIALVVAVAAFIKASKEVKIKDIVKELKEHQLK